MRYLAMILMALTAIGCASPAQERPAWDYGECGPNDFREREDICHGQFTYDPSEFTTEQWIRMHRAVYRWNELAGRELVTLTRVDSDAPVACRIRWHETSELDYWGEYRWATGEIYMDPTKGWDDGGFEAVITHEIGHAMGLNHRTEGSVMCSAAHGEFNESDVAQFQSIYGQ